MATKPTETLNFEPSGSGAVALPTGKQAVGFLPGEKPPAQYLSWLFRTFSRLYNYVKDGQFSGPHSIAGTFDVTGNTTVTGTMGVTGSATVSGTLGVTGIATFAAAPVLSAGATASAGQTITSPKFLASTDYKHTNETPHTFIVGQQVINFAAGASLTNENTRLSLGTSTLPMTLSIVPLPNGYIQSVSVGYSKTSGAGTVTAVLKRLVGGAPTTVGTATVSGTPGGGGLNFTPTATKDWPCADSWYLLINGGGTTGDTITSLSVTVSNPP